MRIRESTHFPHPVLSIYTDDYDTGHFNLHLDTVEDAAGEGVVSFKGSIDLDCDRLSALLASGEAALGLMVTCRDTYYDEWHPQKTGKFTLTLGEGQLRGAVYVQAMMVAAGDLALTDARLTPGFGSSALVIRAGQPLAISAEHQLEIGFDKLVAMESIFSLVPDDSVPKGQFVVNTDAETIEICAGEKTFADIQLIRGTLARDALLPALYLPVLMEALDVMKAGEFTERRWHRVIRAKCNVLGLTVDPHTDSLVDVAQQLLKSPFGLLGKVLGDME